MELKLKQLKNINAEYCVTISLNTHRTHPDNLKDGILLKNLIKEAEQRLLADENKRDVQHLVQRLQKLESQIDHNQNLESLILFVNEEMAEHVRLPIEVENRVVIDHTFATRDLVRAMHIETRYYILLLSQQKKRLIEAFNDKFVREIEEPFPIENTQFYSTSGDNLSNAPRQTNLIGEFFNRIDKEVNKVRKGKTLPVLICTEIANYHEYLKVADQRESIYDFHLNMNRVEEKNHHIVPEAWKLVKAHTVEKNNARKTELEQAVGTGKFLSDVNDIWKAIFEGRVQTLFIEMGLFQPGLMEDGKITFVPEEDRIRKEVVDDIYDEMIEANMNFGGDVVFLPQGALQKFNGFAAVTRY